MASVFPEKQEAMSSAHDEECVCGGGCWYWDSRRCKFLSLGFGRENHWVRIADLSSKSDTAREGQGN